MSSHTVGSLFSQRDVDADITLREYEESEPIRLHDQAFQFLKNEVNGGEERDGDRIEVVFDKEGMATLRATSFVGVVSLPKGPTIEIQPKAKGTPLLHLLRYAHGVRSTTFGEETRLARGTVFIEAIAGLFESELSRVLTHGLHTDYREFESAERRLRGHLDLHRQLQRQPPQPTTFECTYEELTPDITINQAILYATMILLQLSQDTHIVQALQRHQQVLRRQVTLRPVEPRELERVEVTRLNDYYEDILRFTRMVLKNTNISELTAGRRSSFSLLINMNTIFEKVVERAAKDALSERPGWRVRGQERSIGLVEGGRYSVALQPDFIICDSSGTVRIVGDAKWKTDSPQNADFYQMAAYELAHMAPGLLVYPEQGNTMESSCRFANGQRLDLIELPTASNSESFDEFQNGLSNRMAKAIGQLIN